MAQILEYVKIALMNIKSNRGRSILTMLGIIIGIASVIMVIAIGNGVRGQVNNELEGLAGGQIVFYVDSSRKETTVTFDQSDFDAIEANIEHVKGVTPELDAYGTAEGPKGNFELTMKAGNPGLQYTSSDAIVAGRYFSQDDCDAGQNVCVITESSAVNMFGTTDVVGLTFEVTVYGVTQELRVIGIRADSASSLISMAYGNQSVQAECPLSFMSNKLYYDTDEFGQFYVIADNSAYCTQVAQETLNLLEARHGVRGENQIAMQSFTDVSSEFNSILSIITVFISLVAAISLLVGGIGVMNIMLVSVTERTREIGIRKALGARTTSILLQFLAEAGIITLMGGVIGIIFGIVAAWVACTLAGLTASVQPSVVILATLFSCGVGIFFGIYPAKKAAGLSPIEALRHE